MVLRSKRMLVIPALFVAFAAVWWLRRPDIDDRAAASNLLPAGPSMRASSEATELAESEASSNGKPATVERVPAANPSAIASEVGDAQSLPGRVILPEGTPQDESIEVVLRGTPHAGEWSAADIIPVSASGQFRLPVRPEWEWVQVSLRARYLCSDFPQQIRTCDLKDEFVFTPELGGRIVGVLVPPRSDPTLGQRWIGENVNLDVREVLGAGSTRHVEKQSAEVDQELRFEFDGLRPANRFGIDARSKDLVAFERDDLVIEPGKTTELTFDLQVGFRLAGRVVDEAGEGVDADVRWSLERPGRSSGRAERVSDVTGEFELPRLPRGTVELRVEEEGYLTTCWKSGPMGDGDEQKDVVLVLRRGARISGRVQWSDGRPAAQCALEIEQPHAHATGDHCWQRDAFKMETDEDGSFDVSGLGTEACAITARAPADESSGEKTNEEATLTCRVEDVTPGTSGLLLVLGEGLSISGSVVDDTGAAINAFEVRAGPSITNSFGGWWRQRAKGRFHDPSGRFRLNGFSRGSFDVAVQARDHAACTLAAVDVPNTRGDLSVVLPRLAKLSGIVVDPAGKPVKNAHLQLRSARPAALFDERDSDAHPVTDDQGRFKLRVGPGSVQLIAAADGWAESAPLDVDVAPGQSIEDLRIIVRSGGSLAGEVLDEVGRPRAGMSILVHSRAFQSHDLVSDAQGHFATSRLPPGSYYVSVLSRASSGTPHEPPSSGSGRSQVQVAVRDGEETHVVLGGAPSAHVHVHGTVTCAHSPVGAVEVTVDVKQDAWARTTSDQHGRYELTLEAAGPAEFRFGSATAGTSTTRRVTLPNEKDFALDLELATGRITGRALGPDGHGISGLDVSLRDAHRLPSAMWGADGWTETQQDGTFFFDHVSPGTYSISAEVHANRSGDTERGLGPTTRNGIVVDESGKPAEVELHVPASGRVQGIVRDALGLPAPGAAVHARDENGQLITSALNCRTDGQGRFDLGILPPGRLRIQARTGRLASPPVVVSVRSRTSSDVELALAKGTILRVVVEDATGSTVHSGLSVVDELGNEFADSWPLEWEALSSDTGLPGVLLGPLAPGQFTVVATDDRNARASAQVALTGEKEQTLHLRLPK